MRSIRFLMAASLAVHGLSFLLMLQGVEPVATYFYSFAWWSYILFLSCFNHLKGHNSLLLDRPRQFFWIFLFSTPVWLFFELCNFRLHNWHYIGVPSQMALRWPGYFIAFGTVLPGIFETETLIRNLGFPRRGRGRPIRVSPGLHPRFLLLGGLMMALALIRPHYFFPLVWVGLIFLLDPVVYRSADRETSFTAQLGRGDYSQVVRLLAAGMVCGLLWEFWNYWAGAKWVYTVPFVGWLKIFEMPLLGFFGFPPFALECYLLYRLFLLWQKRARQDRWLFWMSQLLAALYCGFILAGIDRWTVFVWAGTQ